MSLPILRTLAWVQITYTAENAGQRAVTCGVRVTTDGPHGLDTVTSHTIENDALAQTVADAILAELGTQTPVSLGPIPVGLPEDATLADAPTVLAASASGLG